jgi:hypothetical protein
MQEAGILGLVLGGVGYVAPFARLVRFETDAGVKPSVARRLAVLGCRIDEDALRIGDRLRLSNAERDRIAGTLSAARSLWPMPDLRTARRILYAHGVEAYRDGVSYVHAVNGGGEAACRDLLLLTERWAIPKFPLGGRDIVGGGIRGPAVGELLRALEAWWIEQDFRPDETALRGRLQQMVASAQ